MFEREKLRMDWYHMTTKVHDRQKAKGLSIERLDVFCRRDRSKPGMEHSAPPETYTVTVESVLQ
jgi:hypothetical protein